MVTSIEVRRGPETHTGWDEMEPVQVGNLEIEPESFSAVLKGKQMSLTSREYQLLIVLAQHAGSVLSHDFIARQLWNSTGDKEKRRIGVLIARLRPHLKGLRPFRLETVRNRGYGLVNRGFLNRCGSEEARAAMLARSQIFGATTRFVS
jgi:DNA-binding response OmpR family regulator